MDANTGSVVVSPARRLSAPVSGRNLRVHVIAGGGCAGELLRRLVFARCRVSCGGLNQKDTDAQTAEAMGVSVALEKPFSPVGPSALARAQAMAGDAACVVVCETPFGPGNVSNLEIAAEALRRGCRVLVNDSNIENRDYTPDRSASAMVRKLLSDGAVPWKRIDQVTAALADISG